MKWSTHQITATSSSEEQRGPSALRATGHDLRVACWGKEISKLGKDFCMFVKGKEIPRKIIEDLWRKHFSVKPLPKIIALNLEPEQFQDAIRRMLADDPSCDTRMQEYGEMVEDLDGASFKGRGTYFILRCTTSNLTLEEILLHELQHIFRGDIDLKIHEGKFRS